MNLKMDTSTSTEQKPKKNHPPTYLFFKQSWLNL